MKQLLHQIRVSGDKFRIIGIANNSETLCARKLFNVAVAQCYTNEFCGVAVFG